MDTITINGKAYRVECNWRACVAFLQMKGSDSMEALTEIVSMAPSDCAALAFCCISEGERLEGRDCDLKPDFIELLPLTDAMQIISAFIGIYSEQASPKLTVSREKKKE